MRGVRLPQHREDALAGWEGGLVATLVDGETLGDHQSSIHGRAKRLQLLDAAGSCEEFDLSQVPVRCGVSVSVSVSVSRCQ